MEFKINAEKTVIIQPQDDLYSYIWIDGNRPSYWIELSKEKVIDVDGQPGVHAIEFSTSTSNSVFRRDVNHLRGTI